MIRLRAKGYFERFQASIHRIYDCLSRRIVDGRYGIELSRSRQRHWMLALQRQVAAFLGEGFRGRMLEGFEALVQRALLAALRKLQERNELFRRLAQAPPESKADF